jgi:protein-disulfide isomerase
VAIIEYADFECPSCAQFAKTTEPVLFREYVETGRVLFVFKHFPLPIHPGAPAAAQAAWCAGRQGKFWEFAGQLFRMRGSLEDADLTTAGLAVSLNGPDFEACRTADDSARHVQSERAEGENLQVPGTPTFFIGRLRPDGRVDVSDVLLGAKPIEEFQPILGRLLGS